MDNFKFVKDDFYAPKLRHHLIVDGQPTGAKIVQTTYDGEPNRFYLWVNGGVIDPADLAGPVSDLETAKATLAEAYSLIVVEMGMKPDTERQKANLKYDIQDGEIAMNESA